MSRYKTPLRYPGGKQKLSPFIAEIIDENSMQGCHYVEPYAGGAGVAIELLLGGYASCVHLNDSSFHVYAFWKSILSETENFCRKISRTSLSVTEWRKQQTILRSPENHSLLDVGFSTFYLNRCNRSGILNGGLIGGLAQDGDWRMDARFPRLELIKRIEVIAAKKSRIRLRNWDAERFMQEYIPRLGCDTLVYCDPPYFNKADRLYLNHYKPSDHSRIAKVIQKIKHKWVVSYDGAQEIMDLYSKRRMFSYSLQYNAAKAYTGTELFIFSDKLSVPQVSSVSAVNQALLLAAL